MFLLKLFGIQMILLDKCHHNCNNTDDTKKLKWKY